MIRCIISVCVLMMICVYGYAGCPPREKTVVCGNVSITPIVSAEDSSISYYKQWVHGYCAHYFVVSNNSPVATHVVTLSFEGWSNKRVEYERSFVVSPRESQLVSLPILPSTSVGNDVKVSIDGRSFTNRVDVDVYEQYWFNPIHLDNKKRSYNEGVRSALLSPRLSEKAVLYRYETLTKSNNEERKDSGKELIYRQSVIDVCDWDEHWLAYSRYDAVILSAEDWRNMSEAVHKALSTYVIVGGELIFVGITNMPSCVNNPECTAMLT